MDSQVITLNETEWLTLRSLMQRLVDFGWDPEVTVVTATHDESVKTFLISATPIPDGAVNLAVTAFEQEFVRLLTPQK